MGKSLVVSAAALLSILFLTSCGPEKTARERELDQLDKTVRKNKADNDQVAGWYGGTITYMNNVKENGAQKDMCLYIFSTTAFEDVIARGETVEVAVLGAYIFLPQNPVAYTFSKSKYNVEAQTLRFVGEIGSTVVGQTLLDLNKTDKRLVGSFYAPNLFSKIDVSLTDQTPCLKKVGM